MSRSRRSLVTRAEEEEEEEEVASPSAALLRDQSTSPSGTATLERPQLVSWQCFRGD